MIYSDLYILLTTIDLQIGIHSLTRDYAYWYEIASLKLSKIYRLLLLMLSHIPLSAPLVQSLLDNFFYDIENIKIRRSAQEGKNYDLLVFFRWCLEKKFGYDLWSFLMSEIRVFPLTNNQVSKENIIYFTRVF